MMHYIENLQPNDHAALFYRNRTEQFEAAIPYIQVGLARNERCLYIASDNPVRIVIDALEAAGVDVDREMCQGRLTVASQAETYLKYGVFEPDKMIEGLIAEVERSVAQGYKTFRATGELAWALALPSSLMRLHEYEAKLDLRFPNGFMGLCQYNETSFRPEIISQMMRVHPKIVTRGRIIKNPFYVPYAKSLQVAMRRVGVAELMAVA
jgi:hypothetical protein